METIIQMIEEILYQQDLEEMINELDNDNQKEIEEMLLNI